MIYKESAAKVQEQLSAIEKLDGYPKRPSHVGSAFVGAARVPDAYSPGAIGWTDKLAAAVDAGGGLVECTIPDEIANKYDGQTTTVDGKTVTVTVKVAQPSEPKPPSSGTK